MFNVILSLFVAASLGAPGASCAGSSAILVPHHLLASSLIEQTFEQVRGEVPQTVVIISPDHFDQGHRYGTTNVPEISKWLGVESKPFVREHGVYNITPYVKKFFPHAKIIPVIIKDSAPEKFTSLLAADLSYLPTDTLFVGSFDFSHNADLKTTKARDIKSLAVLESGNWENLSDVSVDSIGGLRLFLQVAKNRNLGKFVLTQNTNSALLSGRTAQPDVTSYIVGCLK